MEQAVSYGAIPGVMLLNIPNLNEEEKGANLPNPSEHRTVLVSRKFITGIETSVTKQMNNAVEESITLVEENIEPIISIEPEIVQEQNFSMPTIEDTTTINTPIEETSKLNLEEILAHMEAVIPKESLSVESLDEESGIEEKVLPIENNVDSESLSNETATTIDNNLNDIDNSFSDSIFLEVQNNINSLTETVAGFTQQKVEITKQQDDLKTKEENLIEREQKLIEKEKRVQEQKENNDKLKLENKKIAEENAKILTERTISLKAIATEIENKEKIHSSRLNEIENKEKNNKETSVILEEKTKQLNIKEQELKTLSDELRTRLTNLVDAENRFKKLVQEFNETVKLFSTTH